MDEILKLTQEKSTWLFLAEGLTQKHQQSVKHDILRKADNLQLQINELKLALANDNTKESNCNIPHVSGSLLPHEVKFVATRFAHQCRLKGIATNNDTINLYDEWIKDFKQ